MTDRGEPERKKSPEGTSTGGGVLPSLFTNPVVGAITMFLSLAGIALTVVFGLMAFRHRDLVYMVNPARMVVVKAGQTSHLTVLYDQVELKGDVTAVQVGIWNRGNEPIRPENVLEAVTLATDPRTRFLEATVRKKSRDVAGVDLDLSQLESGVVPISWKILEKGDGATIQVIYEGGPDVAPLLNGVVEGQHSIRSLKLGRTESARFVGISVSAGILSAVLAVAGRALAGDLKSRKRPRRRELGRVWWIGMTVGTLAVLGAAMYLLAVDILSTPGPPPFGF